jgi:hypothetical protein
LRYQRSPASLILLHRRLPATGDSQESFGKTLVNMGEWFYAGGMAALLDSGRRTNRLEEALHALDAAIRFIQLDQRGVRGLELEQARTEAIRLAKIAYDIERNPDRAA